MALSNIQCQPNTKTTIEIGIVNPQPEKTYIFFAEIKQDSTTSQLADGMDYLSPNVSSLIKTLTNIHTVADTTFGEIKINDQTHQQFIKAGLVQVDDSSLKYSAMKTTYWVELDMIEPMQAGFFIRKK
jgi:diphthamide synthase subunit DPH2